MDDIKQASIQLHQDLQGKISLKPKLKIKTRRDLSLAYTPGVGAVCEAIAADKSKVWTLTSRKNWVAVVTDGSAVLGLGNLGPEAAMPVMEGKAVLFKEFAGLDAFPICLNTQDPDKIVAAVQAIAPSFAAINLEDIAAPQCFEIERRLRETLDIPVMHDDQHGTAIVVLAGLMNAAKVVGKKLSDLNVVVNGVGAAGSAIGNMLMAQGVSHIVFVDSHGIVGSHRSDLTEEKRSLLAKAAPHTKQGSLADAIKGADVFIGVSKGNVLTKEMVATMAPQAIVFALANPTPEIMPDLALAGGAAVVATGRSDFANQINNVLAYPGIFRGAIDAGAKDITEAMKLAAAKALAKAVKEPTAQMIIPDALDKKVARKVAKAVAKAAQKEMKV